MQMRNTTGNGISPNIFCSVLEIVFSGCIWLCMRRLICRTKRQIQLAYKRCTGLKHFVALVMIQDWSLANERLLLPTSSNANRAMLTNIGKRNYQLVSFRKYMNFHSNFQSYYHLQEIDIVISQLQIWYKRCMFCYSGLCKRRNSHTGWNLRAILLNKFLIVILPDLCA